MNKDPWYKTTLHQKILDQELVLDIPDDVFSTQRIDEGTILLLENLPPVIPKKILDMGCGYGALGLPIAKKKPTSQVTMVDRDLLAVKWAQINAAKNKIVNVDQFGSLGFREVLSRNTGGFDWILCNVPARIGRPFIEALFLEGNKILNQEGEIRVVVIRDLESIIELIQKDYNLNIQIIHKGPRHTIYSYKKSAVVNVSVKEELYKRDSVLLGGLELYRPYDFGGDDPKRIQFGLPILFEAIPKSIPNRIFCNRAGYGQIPLVAKKLFPNSQITAFDRDLLAIEFSEINSSRLNLEGPKVKFISNSTVDEVSKNEISYDLILAEISSAASSKVIESEISFYREILSKEGQALLLCLEKTEKSLIDPLVKSKKLQAYPLIKRNSYSLLRLIK